MATNHQQQTLSLEWPTGYGPPLKFVYFGAKRGFIKIGTSVSPQRRAKELGLHLLAWEPGGRVREQELHRRFASARLVGEWFLSVPEILDYVSALSVPKRRAA